jgi:hypothetical protein
MLGMRTASNDRRQIAMHKIRCVRWASVIFGLLAVSVALPAEALRCANMVISRGEHAAKLLRYCGEPSHVQVRRGHRGLVGLGYAVFPAIGEEVLIEEWTYNFGPNRLMRVIRIENGIVRRIDRLGYGYADP